MLLTAAWPPASGELSAPCTGPWSETPGGRARRRRHSMVPRGRAACSSIGGFVSDFALAPLRGLDVQTSPERAKREGPAWGRRRREAPLLKGAGRAPWLGRTRGRKEGAGPPGPARGCERPQGGQLEGRGCVFRPPRRGQPWLGRGQLRAPASVRVSAAEAGRGPCAAVAGRRRLVPSPEGPRESKAKASPRRGLCARGGGWHGRRRVGRAGRPGGAVSAPHPACGPRTPPELPGASLKAAPARLFSPFFVTL